jgi:Flp pilus assembly pilin Flp
MKTVVTSFIRDQSGAAELDGMTVFLLAVVFPIAVYFMYSTFGGVFYAIFGWIADAAHVR